MFRDHRPLTAGNATQPSRKPLDVVAVQVLDDGIVRVAHDHAGFV
jgi:hypothetical protein